LFDFDDEVFEEVVVLIGAIEFVDEFGVQYFADGGSGEFAFDVVVEVDDVLVNSHSYEILHDGELDFVLYFL
jgi:hypothetical protein